MKKIPLTCGKFALVDDCDFKRVANRGKWQAIKRSKRWYASSSIRIPNGSFIGLLMHRFIKNAGRGKEVDHRDGDGLNNRRSNLRVCSSSENKWNCPRKKNNTSGFKGVYFDKKRGKFHAQIRQNYKRFSLGFHETAEEAGRAYDGAAKKLHGRFARLNFPPKQPPLTKARK